MYALIDKVMQDNICFALLAFRASLREETGWGGDVRTVNVDVLDLKLEISRFS